ncbi:hypothetical protein DYB25_004146, partial [Aphanomyces astaci]
MMAPVTSTLAVSLLVYPSTAAALLLCRHILSLAATELLTLQGRLCSHVSGPMSPSVVVLCLASLVHHKVFLEDTLPAKHPLLSSVLFGDVGMTTLLRANVTLLSSSMQPTGIPPHVSLHTQLEKNLAAVRALPGEIRDGIESLLDEKGVSAGNITHALLEQLLKNAVASVVDARPIIAQNHRIDWCYRLAPISGQKLQKLSRENRGIANSSGIVEIIAMRKNLTDVERNAVLQRLLTAKGRLPLSIEADAGVVNASMELLSECDLSTVILELASEVAKNLEMSDVCTELERLDVAEDSDDEELDIPSENTGPKVVDMSMTTTEAGEAALGLTYLVFTLVLTLYYLKMLSPVLSNDLWWERFNASGAQSYVIDVYNGQLNLVTHGTVDFTSPVLGIYKDYSTYYTPIEVTPTDHYESSDIFWTRSGRHAVLLVGFQPDVGSGAHMRQKRCQTRYIENAAMYWETTARLVNWKTFMDKREGEWNVTVADGLRKTPEGRAWLTRTPNAFKDLPTEMALWKQAGLTYFTLQYMNAVTWSVTETMSIANAFGSHEEISNKRMTGRDRDWSLWMYQWSPGNDIYVAQACGYSFIRSDSANQQFTYPCDYADYLLNPANYTCDPCNSPWNPVPGDCAPDWEWMMGMPDVPIVQMVRSNVGPFGSIDAFFVPAPASLKTLYATFHTLLTELAQSNQAFHNALVAIPGYHADPVPPSWLNPSYEYMGGDPSCTDRQPLPFVQSSMAFDIACTDQSRHTMLLHRFNTLFALWASKASPPTMCSLCPTLASVCLSVVVPSVTALDLFNNNAVTPPSDSLVQVAKADIVTLNVGTLQFAFNIVDSTNVFLTQPLLASTLSAWDAFGWVYLYEWAAGIREVVSIEGDRGVFSVVSNTYDPIINEAGALEVPKSACQYLWIISVTVSAILVSVGAIFTGYTVLMRFRIVGRNLFRFNRIVGVVWLGRPLLLVRGMTAVVLLSTSPLDFGVIHGFTRFEFAPRTFVESMIVSGEAMWISYVIHDVLLLFTRHYELHFAPISTGLCWLVYVIIDVASPYKIEATLDQLCTVDYRICGIRCTSGAISMGNVKRAMMLLVIQVVCIAVAFCVVKVWQCVRPTQSAKSAFTGHLLLSGSATAFLHKETTEKGAWMVDRAACVMCGLITFRSYFFDTKLWLLLVDRDANEVVKWNKKLFEPPELNLALRDDEADISTYASKVVQIRLETSSRKRFFAMAAGLGYVFATIFASITYLTLTSTNMTNDFWWANYNASREHVYVARMYNSQLLYRPHGGTVSLDSTIFVDDADYNSSLAKGVEVTM